MAKSRTQAPPAILELPVVWGNVNIGDETAAVGCSVERKHLTLAQADKHLCNKRLVATIQADAGNDNPDQPAAFDAGEELSAAFDVHSFGVTKKKVKFGLTCNLGSVNIETLAHFAKRAGKVIVTELGDIPEKKAGKGEDAGEGDDEE